ncbi:GyrI-like domain-containing protein [Ulvibacterium sp.]|uniref:GyrI-like domain-containing protein n=1 Tax=Ulvibacterium sp. TaxID=2665914 RepID=UPI002635DC02|nr:GyrI-like domain-containing protein [Ulvibacterium sp.]
MEKKTYVPKENPEIVEIPEFRFLTIEGEGSPQNKVFAEYITVLYSVSYAIKMNLKKESKPPSRYFDYTVYPLEGIWDITAEAKTTFTGKIDKNDLVFKLMIRQPDFVSDAYFKEMLEQTQKRKPHPFLEQLKFEPITDGKCIQMMHIGSYDDEPRSFKTMEDFAEKENLSRISKEHREIYLSDFRKVAPEKLKTVLRFRVEPK